MSKTIGTKLYIRFYYHEEIDKSIGGWWMIRTQATWARWTWWLSDSPSSSVLDLRLSGETVLLVGADTAALWLFKSVTIVGGGTTFLVGRSFCYNLLLLFASSYYLHHHFICIIWTTLLSKCIYFVCNIPLIFMKRCKNSCFIVSHNIEYNIFRIQEYMLLILLDSNFK